MKINIFGLAFISVFGVCASGFAGPLDKNACTVLNEEVQNLQALNVQKLMEKGPEWAVANLSPGDLAIVRRFIDVDEQIKFRCTPASSLVRLNGLEEEEEDDLKPIAAGKSNEEDTADDPKPKDANAKDDKLKTDKPATPNSIAPAKRQPVKPAQATAKPERAQSQGQQKPVKPAQANVGAVKPPVEKAQPKTPVP